MSAQQNLVYNGDFELYSSCPLETSNPSQTNYEISKCTGWNAPTLGTSDYFNVCSNLILPSGFNIGVPKNIFGYQNAYNGNGYLGLYAFWDFSPCQYREYVQTKLNTPLTAGKSYAIEYYVSLANYQAAVNSISALFTTTKITSNDDCFIVATPQVKYTSGYITDSLGWTKISGSFLAQGGEEYLTIGFFEDTTNHVGVLPLIPDTVSLGYFSVYYYIDGIELKETQDISNPKNCSDIIPNVFTPNADGINDVLRFTTCNKIINTTIYNRWGNLVFNTENQNYSWDGKTTSGEPCIDGTYFYIIQTEEKTYKGFIQLIR
jgi:gliding motility-associated-like protein